jgi:WD40 repeat protein
VWSVATAQLDGRPVIISGSSDKTVRVWDLATGTPIGQPLTGHTNFVQSIATAQLNGRPVIVSGSYDSSIRVWDLARRVDS